MDQGPVNPPPQKAPSWHLAPPTAARTQGLVVSGFKDLPTGRALFLQFGWDGAPAQGGGAWLAALAEVAPITDADGRDPRAAAMAFTWLGLQKMGLDANTLESFDRPFKEGMFQEDRLRRLGDRRGRDWLSTVIAGGPRWSGNTPLDRAAYGGPPQAFATSADTPPERQISTPVTVHAALFLYTADEASAEAWCTLVSAVLAPFQVTVSHRLPLNLRFDANNIGREHFGFADGLSQPMPYEPGKVTLSTGGDAPKDPWHGVPLGDILMGYRNSHAETAAGPVVPDDARALAADLPAHPRGEGFRDLGIDGSYLVVRELQQDVAAFWQAMDAGADKINAAQPPKGQPVDADWIASRVIGRDLDGNLLTQSGVLPKDTFNQPGNALSFFDTDRLGHGCPMGSHVRRGNPRDGLAPTPGDKQTLLDAANSHRILRRGRKYGPDIADPRTPDGADRGLLFMCLNTDIMRQFEFVQQTWMLNPNFAFLYDETDPLIGPSCTFTIPQDPLRRIVPVDTFVRMVGGEYFFLPSLPALGYLRSL